MKVGAGLWLASSLKTMSKIIDELNRMAEKELSSSKIKPCCFCKTLKPMPRWLYKENIICKNCWDEIIERGYISKVKEITDK